MLSELKRSVLHNCASDTYRSPIGAVPAGSEVLLRVRVRSSQVLSVSLVLFNDKELREVSMAAEGDWYAITVTLPDTVGVLWYYFRLHCYGEVWHYGAAAEGCSLFGEVYHDRPPAFQLTVYTPSLQTPQWFRDSVLYQIFPDRFAPGHPDTVARGLAYHQALGRQPRLHQQWSEQVEYLPQPGERYYSPNDFFGGTLDSIRQRLPYLHSLGVGVIYLNPIFEADSNHRYNTADYLRIDPILGTEADFCRLCAEARRYEIRIILDGVFSHTGSDSVYFNKEGRYPQPGAYQGQHSPYWNWYEFYDFPERYNCWWGFASLPAVRKEEPSWQDFVITGAHSVIRHWLRCGASGFRLDVADEIPDDVLCLIRQVVKEEQPDGLVLGEVWEDATSKHSYGVPRQYALGESLDSVMNYPLRNAVVDFLTGRMDGRQLTGFLLRQRLNYPAPIYYALMNLLSSHDIERIRTALSVRLDARELSCEQQAYFRVHPEQDARGQLLQRLAVALVYSLPGVPAIYYGDEQGMQGFLDPFNRAPFVEGETALVEEYQLWAQLRKQYPALRSGAAAFLPVHGDVCCVLRFDTQGEALLSVVNRSRFSVRCVVDLYYEGAGLTAAEYTALRDRSYTKAACLLNTYQADIQDGLLLLELPAQSASLLLLS